MKIFVFFISVIFVLSVVAVHAQGYGYSNENNMVISARVNASVTVNGTVNEDDNNDDTTIRERIRQQLQERVQERVETINERMEQMRERYMEAKSKYEEAREKMVEARSNWRLHNNTQNRTILISHAKVYLNNSLDRMIDHLELVKEKVQNMTVLSDEEKINITADFNSDIAFFQQKQLEVQNAVTLEQMAQLRNEIQNRWVNTRRGVARAVGQFYDANLRRFIEKGDNFAEKLQAAIDRMKADGKNTAELEQLMIEYRNYLENAKNRLDDATNKFESENEGTIREGYGLVRASQQMMQNMFLKAQVMVRARA